jgi:hypothetical protein
MSQNVCMGGWGRLGVGAWSWGSIEAEKEGVGETCVCMLGRESHNSSCVQKDIYPHPHGVQPSLTVDAVAEHRALMQPEAACHTEPALLCHQCLPLALQTH